MREFVVCEESPGGYTTANLERDLLKSRTILNDVIGGGGGGGVIGWIMIKRCNERE
jgi:hypothetical protein